MGSTAAPISARPIRIAPGHDSREHRSVNYYLTIRAPALYILAWYEGLTRTNGGETPGLQDLALGTGPKLRQTRDRKLRQNGDVLLNR